MTLKEFFIDERITIPFKLFGKTHIFLLLLVIMGSGLIILNKSKINNINPKIKHNITRIIAIILLINMATLYISSCIYHNFDYKDMLPFHLCYIANYTYIYSIFFNNNILKYSYFLSLIGPIPAIIFFNVPSTWESFNFYLYVISHHVLVLGSLATFYMYPKTIKVKNIVTLSLILHILYISMSIFNYFFKTNYCFSGGIPPFIINLFPFLKYIPTTIILEITVIQIMTLLYIFYNKQTRDLLYNKNML